MLVCRKGWNQKGNDPSCLQSMLRSQLFIPVQAGNYSLLSLCMDAISYLVEKLHETASNWKLNTAFCKRREIVPTQGMAP